MHLQETWQTDTQTDRGTTGRLQYEINIPFFSKEKNCIIKTRPAASVLKKKRSEKQFNFFGLRPFYAKHKCLSNILIWVIFFTFLIEKDRHAIGKKGGYFPLGMGLKFSPKGKADKALCPGWGGGVLWYFPIYFLRLGPSFGVQNLDFQYFGGFSEKWIFSGVWRFCGYFWGSSQNWTGFRGHFYAF